MGEYILKLIAKRQKELSELNPDDYSLSDWKYLKAMKQGSINDLYMCLTAHDNKYEKK